ncbi:MAG TPA: UDP-N-acetylmuramoyl-L-alanine--D-glutamate ligase [Azospirillaceae bacterium]|nr:UDP-N-acetylmuramoyl-L-alanine--D-glutamate ligase [Azospirillaceae bacterium]
MIDLSFLKDRAIAVMGLGKSGLPTAQALAAAGARVLAWDDGAKAREEAESAGLPLTNLHEADLTGIRTLVLSPGIPHLHPKPNPVAARARAAGIEIIGDIELLLRAQPNARTVGITGTNGKSTTTTLIAHILKGAGLAVEVGGNLGQPVLTFAPFGHDGVYVIEMSSYALERTPSAAFDAAILLNITPDHLDRHGGMDGYIAAKRNIFQNQRPDQAAVIAIDDEHTRRIHDELAAGGGRRVVPISAGHKVAGGVFVTGGMLVDDTDGTGAIELDLSTVKTLPGIHNAQNAAAAYTAARALGVAPTEIIRHIRTFPGLAHRQQLVAEIGGVRYVNDSKATNADATEKALVCYDAIYWILGGQAKETGLAGLERYASRVRHAFLIGEATERFAPWLDANNVPHTRCGDLARAVPAAHALARREAVKGAAVLLSPACASWDQYANFEKRGEHFADLVTSLEAAP